jgi:hypothetical protein
MNAYNIMTIMLNSIDNIFASGTSECFFFKIVASAGGDQLVNYYII